MNPHTPVITVAMGQKNRTKKTKKTQKNVVQSRSQETAPKPSTMSGANSVAPASLKPGFAKQVQLNDVQGDYIRGDIVRILSLLAVVGIILAVLFALDFNTSYIQGAATALSKFLKLQ